MELRCGNGVYGSGMGVNVKGGRGNGGSGGSGGGGGIPTVDASITRAKIAPTTGPSASVNGDRKQSVSPASDNVESVWPVVSVIGCETTTLNDSSFKVSGDDASKTRIDTGYVIVVSPLVVVVAASALYPPSSSVAGQRRSGVWILNPLC